MYEDNKIYLLTLRGLLSPKQRKFTAKYVGKTNIFSATDGFVIYLDSIQLVKVEEIKEFEQLKLF